MDAVIGYVDTAVDTLTQEMDRQFKEVHSKMDTRFQAVNDKLDLILDHLGIAP